MEGAFMKKKIKSVLGVMGYLILTLLIVFIVASGYMNYKFNKTGDIAYIFNVSILTVNTGSMEPLLSAGDVMFIKKAESLEIDDVATYLDGPGYLVTHRVIDENQNGYIFQGDANNVKDDKAIQQNQIRGKYIGHIPGLYFIIKRITHPIGIALIIVLFIILALVKYIFNQLSVLKKETHEGNYNTEK